MSMTPEEAKTALNIYVQAQFDERTLYTLESVVAALHSAPVADVEQTRVVLNGRRVSDKREKLFENAHSLGLGDGLKAPAWLEEVTTLLGKIRGHYPKTIEEEGEG